MENQPKRTHFLPKMILSRFSESDLVWVYDIKTNEYKHLTIDNIAVDVNYYRFLARMVNNIMN